MDVTLQSQFIGVLQGLVFNMLCRREGLHLLQIHSCLLCVDSNLSGTTHESV